jgi:hypothetical protein
VILLGGGGMYQPTFVYYRFTVLIVVSFLQNNDYTRHNLLSRFHNSDLRLRSASIVHW